MKEANAVVERERTIRLSRRDCERFLDLLENPPEPNAKFALAMKEYEDAKCGDTDSSFDWRP
ncbi:type II toxin-antitoxin system TacA family antitoxin [Endothiovibrio diazotrophicus]